MQTTTYKILYLCFRYDFVKVYDGNSISANMLGSYTGNTLPTAIVSTGPNILINLLSDISTVNNGFRVQYSAGK